MPGGERRECWPWSASPTGPTTGWAASPRACSSGSGWPSRWSPGPELVVLDEPTSALDPLGRADVRDIVLSLQARGVAVLLNSHLIGEVERVCDRVVILDRGQVAAVRARWPSCSASASCGCGSTGVDAPAAGPAGRDRPADPERRWLTVALPAEDGGDAVPDLVADLVALGVRVHAVEPVRISLEERLLGILRARGADDEPASRRYRR